MGLLIANAVNVYFGSYDLTCDANKVNLAPKAEAKDSTTFCAGGWKTSIAALKTFDFSADGFWQADAGSTQAVHDQAFAALGASRVVTVVPESPVAGGVAPFFQMMESSYHVGMSIGEIAPFNIAGVSAAGAGVVGGYLFLTRQYRTTSGTSAVINIPGGVPAGQSLYATVHTFGISGTTPTLDVTVKSAAAVGFASPTTRITVPTINTVGGVWAPPSATTTSDAWYRVDFQIAGTTPNFLTAVAVGVR